jgi:hypothetical protein
MTDEERDAPRNEFEKLVNMTPSALRHWLESDESQSVGMTPSGEKVTQPNQSESVGHHVGERIIEIRQQKSSLMNDEDYRDMRKVVGYIHRHRKQRPAGNIEESRWRKSLMNWGHDPLKDEA